MLSLTAFGISRQEFIVAPVIAAGWDFNTEGATKGHVIIIFVGAEICAVPSHFTLCSCVHFLTFWLCVFLGLKSFAVCKYIKSIREVRRIHC